MKKLLILIIYALSFNYVQAQITGEFKNFDPKRNDNIEVQVNYYSALDQEYTELKTKPDSLGSFAKDLLLNFMFESNWKCVRFDRVVVRFLLPSVCFITIRPCRSFRL